MNGKEFRMNWYDFEHHQFMFNGQIYKLTSSHTNYSGFLKNNILFLLNIHRNRWISNDALLEFIYWNVDPDMWGDWQLEGLRATIHNLRKLLPTGIKIVNQYSMGYKLEITDRC